MKILLKPTVLILLILSFSLTSFGAFIDKDVVPSLGKSIMDVFAISFVVLGALSTFYVLVKNVMDWFCKK